MSEFKSTGRLEENLLRLELTGELVYATSTQAREQIRGHFEKIPENGRCLFLTEKVSRIDSTGFGVLIHFVRQAAMRKIQVAVVTPDPFIMDLFLIAKFDRIMTVVDNETAALQAFIVAEQPTLSPQDY
jgi:anti-anti-sigma factor